MGKVGEERKVLDQVDLEIASVKPASTMTHENEVAAGEEGVKERW